MLRCKRYLTAGTIAALLLACCGMAQSEVVAVKVGSGGNAGSGHGFLFHTDTACYLALPEHVHQRRNVLSFFGRVSGLRGTATVTLPKLQGMDLSVAQVQDLRPVDCGTDWSKITGWKLPDPTQMTNILLQRVPSEGRSLNTPMLVIDARADRFVAQVQGDGTSHTVYQGTSGAMAYANDVAVGMALEAANPTEAAFLPMGPIREALARVLNLPQGNTPWHQTEVYGEISPYELTPNSPYDHTPNGPALQLPEGMRDSAKLPVYDWSNPSIEPILPTTKFEEK